MNFFIQLIPFLLRQVLILDTVSKFVTYQCQEDGTYNAPKGTMDSYWPVCTKEPINPGAKAQIVSNESELND